MDQSSKISCPNCQTSIDVNQILYRQLEGDLKKKYDAEAIVIAHLVGKGKYKNILGAMLMEMPNGIQFKLGSGFSDELRYNPPAIGTTVTYQYYGLTKNGKPRFASFLRMRH